MGPAKHLAFVLSLLVAGCGVGDAGSDTPQDTREGDVTTRDTEISVDGEAEGALVLGTNPAGTTDPAGFRPLADGDALNVELGFQDLWMVVLAFRTQDVFASDARLFLTGELTVGGLSQGTLSLAEQRTTDGGDGWAYYYNFFLVVNDPTLGGEPGHIDFSVHDAAGHERSVHLDVQLTGGE